MIPVLPPELLIDILGWAQEGEHPLTCQRTRNAFRSVCRSWESSFDHWSTVAVQGTENVRRVGSLLAGDVQEPPLGSRVKSIFLSFTASEGARSGAQPAASVTSPLANIDLVERVEIEVGHDGIVRGDVIGIGVCDALARLSHVKHFKLHHVRQGWHPRYCPSVSDIKCLLAAWPLLESITLLAAPSSPRAAYDSVFAHHPTLHSVTTDHISFLGGLSPKIRSVTLTDYIATKPDTDPTAFDEADATAVCNTLERQAPRLESLSLQGRFRQIPGAPSRGYHERLIGSLRDIRQLVIPAFAVANLAEALSSLDQLGSVTVTSNSTGYAATWELEHNEVARLVLQAPALRQLTLPWLVVMYWSEEDKAAVGAAAELRGVCLDYGHGWE